MTKEFFLYFLSSIILLSLLFSIKIKTFLYATLFLFIYWFLLHLIFITENSKKIFYFSHPLFVFVFTLIFLKDLLQAAILAFIFGIFIFSFQKYLYDIQQRQLKIIFSKLSRHSFIHFFKQLILFFLLTIFIFILINKIQDKAIFNSVFDFLDFLALNYQILPPSQTTIGDLLKFELKKLNLGDLVSEDYIEQALKTASNILSVNFEASLTLREMFMRLLKENKYLKIVLLLALAMFLISLSQILLSFLVWPVMLVATLMYKILIKLNILKIITKKVDKEVIIIL